MQLTTIKSEHSVILKKTKCGRFAIGYARGGQTHRCRSRQIFRGAKDFCPNFPKLARKNSEENDFKKNQKRLNFILVWAHFSNESTSSTIFVQIYHNLPDKNEKSHDLQNKKNENVCIFISGIIFVKSKHIKRFCKGFHTFCPTFHKFVTDFKGFCPDFHHIKTFGGALALSAPPPPTPLSKPDLCMNRIS